MRPSRKRFFRGAKGDIGGEICQLLRFCYTIEPVKFIQMEIGDAIVCEIGFTVFCFVNRFGFRVFAKALGRAANGI